MNLRKSIVTFAAAVGLMASLAAPAAMAQTSENTANNTALADVQVLADGTFDVFFAPGTVINLGTSTLNASNPGDTTTGSLLIQYTDTLHSRSAFTVTLSATNFTRLQGGTAIIPASGFVVTHTSNVGQTQWGGSPTDPTVSSHHVNDGHTSHGGGDGSVVPVVGDIGDIGFLIDSQSIDCQSCSDGNWTPGLTNLGTGSRVQFGYPGIGTIASGGNVDVELTIPNGTQSGTYRSTLTLSVVFQAP